MQRKSLKVLFTVLLLMAFVAPAYAAPVTSAYAAAGAYATEDVALWSAPPFRPSQPIAPPPIRLSATTPKANAQRNQPAPRVLGETNPGGMEPAIYIVQLSSSPLASYRGGAGDLPATSPAVTGRRLDLRSAEARAYLAHLSREHRTALDAIQRILGRPVEVRFTYQVAFNGFALVLTPVEAAKVTNVPGVARIYRDFTDQIHTDAGPAWIGAPAIWSGTPATKGEGIVVGVIDTGIHPYSLSFANVGADGHVHTNPRGKFYGVCDPDNGSIYDPSFPCNNKLIGAWDFADYFEAPDGPRDNDGHGSHTASTAAGNVVFASVVAPTYVYTNVISGVAPHANIIAYDACAGSACPGSSLLAAINQAVADGVDVINYSIGGGSRDPWNSPDALAMLAALDAGVYVSVSAGNSGPDAATIGSPSNAPWVTSVAAATHNRTFLNGLVNLAGGNVAPPANITGQGLTGAYGPAPIVYAGNYTSTLGEADPYCQAPFPPGTFNGEIVVCDRGLVSRVEKSHNVAAGGAGGFVLANDAANGASLNSDAYAIPGVHITYADGVALKSWIAGGGTTTAAIAGTTPTLNPTHGDILAAFSSRGPDATSPFVLKPDVTAPGVDIIAAIHTGGNYALLSGTSMAAPHNAGAAALLRALFPSWSPAEIRSALMLTAKTPVLKEDGSTSGQPFDRGAGRIDVAQAARTGFVLNESALNFYQANPNTGGDPRALNLAGLADPQCVGVCTWTRTLKSVRPTAESYTVNVSAPVSMTLSVQPNAFTLPAGGTQVITITANVTSAALNAWIFGEIAFDAANPALADGHMPVAVYTRGGAASVGLAEIVIETRRSQGVITLEGVRAIHAPTLTKALYLGVTQTITGSVAQDPTNFDPFDIENGGVFTTLVSVTDPQTARLAFTIDSSTAPDLDLLVGLDQNSNGQPDLAELLCISASPSWDEYCVLDDPAPGTYWAIVQNWQGSGAATDSFKLSVSQVSRSNQSPAFTVTGPPSAALGVPFNLQLTWNFPGMQTGERRFALLEVGTSNSQPNNVLSLPVILRRLQDDVTAASESPNLTEGGFVLPGEVVTHTLTLRPERNAPSPVNYIITATLPAGQTYIPGSAVLASSASQVQIDPIVSGNRLIWSLPNVVTMPRYVMSTNDPNRADYSPACATILGNAYVSLGEVGIPLLPGVEGNGKRWNVDDFFGGAGPYTFFGQGHPALFFTDDGVLSVVGFDPALTGGVNAPIPTPAAPNGLLAPAWADFKIVYDENAGAGVRVAGAYGGLVMFVEYNGLQRNDAQPGSLDMQAQVWREIDPDFPEIVFAYNNITGMLPSTVTGLENIDGSQGVTFTDALRDGLLICFDWTVEEITLTYRTQVRNDAVLDSLQTTVIESALSAPGFGVQSSTSALFVTGVALNMRVDGPSRVFTGSPVTYTLTIANRGPAAANNLTVMAEMPVGSQHVSGGSVSNGIVSFSVPTLGPGATTQLQYSVRLDENLTAGQVGAASAHSPTIIGGGPADPGEYPWQVALLQANTGQWWGCGGSLISPSWVATAAHCVSEGGSAVTSPSALHVVVGRHDLTTNEGQRIPVAEVHVHPNFNPATFDSDIALLRLRYPVTLTTTVQPIALVTAGDAALFAPGVEATVTGWGTRTAGAPDFPNELYEVNVPIVAQDVCAFTYAAQGAQITNNMLCAGLAVGGKDACQGDSGGPLIVPDGAGGFKLAGVVSWGIGCAQPGLPGIYTRVSNFVEWIGLRQDTLTTGRYMVTDNTNLPGHSYVGDDPVTTIVRTLRMMLPIISR
ncbi:MAG: trypsin-like serine protease [Caldilinea sp.]|nr:trypsin-like serine protease [Caldilinea sp.]MDW8442076.1 trypsin-like serine protease [Caldilineaceae bacterium]